MKNRIRYLILIIAMLLSACSGGTVATTPTVTPPATQATSAAAAVRLTSSSPTQTTALSSVAMTPTDTTPAAEAISASAAVTQTSSSRTETTASVGRADGGAPPAEALAACTGKNAQATCEFTWQKGVETGLCEMVQAQLACSPRRDPASTPSARPAKSGPPQTTPAGEKGGPTGSRAGEGTAPAEAIAACTGKSTQAACEFTWQKGAETGVCEMVQEQMTCSPQRVSAGPPSGEPGNSSPPRATPAGEMGRQTGSRAGGATPPAEAFAACTGKSTQTACEFISPKGAVTGICEAVQGQLACSPRRDPGGNPPPGAPRSQPGDAQDASTGATYNIDQAISDKAQGMTIAFDALAFLTGDLGSDSFFPPGKVADFWGFQYLRDNDPSRMGHAGDFLTSAAMNMLNTLTANQRAELVALAKSQVEPINEYGYKRFVLMDAFRRLLEGILPAGTTGLNEAAVRTYSAGLYRLDGGISFARAQVMGKLINAMEVNQKAYLDAMVGKGMLDWPKVEEPADIRGLDRDVKVAVMTYAADMYSWYAGSVDADVYFCPERHGTYFGSFYLKDIHAMSDPTYAIPTNLTGDMGENLLRTLTSDQAQLITSLVDVQQPSLTSLVEARKQVSTELRKFKDGSAADKATVLGLMEEYGACDGEIIYNMAVHFSEVGRSLTDDQRSQLLALRKEMLGDRMHPSGAYLYSQAIAMPEIPEYGFSVRVKWFGREDQKGYNLAQHQNME